MIHNIGFGNDNAPATDSFNVESHGPAAPFTGLRPDDQWTKYYIPIPAPSVVAAVNGLFYFSGLARHGRHRLAERHRVRAREPGGPHATFGTVVNLRRPTRDPPVEHRHSRFLPGTRNPSTIVYHNAQAYGVGWAVLHLASSDPTMATVDTNGMMVGSRRGTANITVAFGSTPLGHDGRHRHRCLTAPADAGPRAHAPRRRRGLALHQQWDLHQHRGGDLGHHRGGNSQHRDMTTPWAGTTVKKYVGMSFVGVDLCGRFDATTYTNFHVDIWTPDAPSSGSSW